MRHNPPLTLSLGLILIAGAAEACFLGAPWQLFDNRNEIRNATPVNSFAWEVEHLSPATVHRNVPATDRNESYDGQRDAAEKPGLSASQWAAMAAMRAAPNAQAALESGGDLPDAIRLYTAGAVAFAHGDTKSAAALFLSVLALPPGEAASRSVWAAYMLGRIAAKAGDARAAAMAFGKTRDLAAQGGSDPLGLATASLGDEARLRLESGDTPKAVALYAEQAAEHSSEAVQSLRMVAEGLMAHPERLAAAVHDELTQRLLVVHALALTGDYLHALHTGGTEYGIEYDGFFPPENMNTAPLQKLFDAIRGSGVTLAGTDRLAALAYQLGDHASAKGLAESSHTPLALWIQAKVALEDGDDSAGEALMAKALQETAAGDATFSLEPSSVALLRGEASVWDLGRSDFKQAMSVLWPVAKTYWGDVAYLAERVLTTDELKAFVDAHAAKPEPPPVESYEIGPVIDPVEELRGLLARRLMRDGRTQEALGYFDHLKNDAPDIGADASAYGAALHHARTAFWAVDRAQAGWTAAALLRRRGMEMMGTETLPDSAGFSGGALQTGYGPGPGGPSAQQDSAQDELLRYDASRAKPDVRYHYRYLAADLAVAAAAELPPRTQAFAAVLCHASEWMFSSHADDKAQAVYARYLKAGAVVGFATHFGHACPEPDFGSVTKTRERLAWIAARDTVHRHKALFFISGLLVFAGGMTSVIWVRIRQRGRKGI
jgi:hypothetical protein